MKKKSTGIGDAGDRRPVNSTPPRKRVNKRGEKYLAQPGNIEELPTPGQVAETEKAIRKTKSSRVSPR